MNPLEVLQKLGSGDLIEQIYEALVGVSTEVAATGKPGVVTVTLKVSHPKGSDPQLVVVDEDVKRTLPKTEAKGAMFFALEQALFSRDPRQPALPAFRVMEDASSVTREPEQPTETVREAGGN